MHHVLITLTVEDYPRFLAGFRERGQPLRARHGSQGARVLPHADDPARVSLVLSWSSAEAMQGFFADPEVKASMAAGGTVGPPQIIPLADSVELPA